MSDFEKYKYLKRKVEINNLEFTVFGKAPWVTVDVEASDKNPACTIILEGHLLAFSLNRNKLIYNALATKGSNGAIIGVVFVGEDGKARATEICNKLNFQLG
jgi:hypothetical protein